MVAEPEKTLSNIINEDNLDVDSSTRMTPDTTVEKGTQNADWDSRLELLRVCSSNGKFVTKKARAPPIGGKWATDEDEHLRDIVKAHGAENWRKVASLLGPTRTDVQCLHRWNKVLRPGLQKGAWSAEEDKLVREAVQYQAQNGVGRILWSEIATQLPGRLGKQCRERYFNHLDPSINKGDWTPPEDRILYEGQKQFGNRWCEISKVLPGRTENSVKNRWNSSAMRRWLKENSLSAGDGTPLHDIAAIEDLQRALKAFSDALAVCGISISKETAATLLSDMTSLSVSDSKTVAKDKVKKEKLKKGKSSTVPEIGSEFIFDEFTDIISRSSSWEGIGGGAEMGSRDMDREREEGQMCPVPLTLSRSSSGSHSLKSRSSSATGMMLPSHLRPPHIVTVRNQEEGRPPSGPSTASTVPGEDHLLLVELLSNMKSSPKWGLPEQVPTSTISTMSALSCQDRKRSQILQNESNCDSNGNGNGNCNGNGIGIGNCNNNNNNENDIISNSNNNNNNVSSKRMKVENEPEYQHMYDDLLTPTDRALRCVRQELARRDREKGCREEKGRHSLEFGPGSGSSLGELHGMSSSSDRQGNEIVPFQLLPFFKYLDHHAQRCLMRQLVDHFQQTSYTPRNFNALLPTPRFIPHSSSSRPIGYTNQHCISATGSYSYGYSQTGTLTLCSPRGENHFNNARIMDHTFDPKCFEEDSPSALVGEKYQSDEYFPGIREDIYDNADGGDLPFDAPVEAAVNVALKCATREASFEEVLSWLGRAPEHFAQCSKPVGQYASGHNVQNQSHLVGHSEHSVSNSSMSIPSHLRPPLIVIAGAHSNGAQETSAATNSEDHLMLVELLSNMKSSPKWGLPEQVPTSTISTMSALSCQDRKRSQILQNESNCDSNGNGNGNCNGNGIGIGNCNNGNNNNNNNNIISNNNNNSNNVSSKRLKVENDVGIAQVTPHEDILTPTDRALNRVREEITRREIEKSRNNLESGSSNPVDIDSISSSTGRQGNDIVPFQLLPFFRHLDHHAQRCLMRQLVDHFQQTSYTPRNFNALLPTPRFSYPPTHLSHLSAGGGSLADDIKPNLFEEGAATFTAYSSFSSQQSRYMGDVSLIPGEYNFSSHVSIRDRGQGCVDMSMRTDRHRGSLDMSGREREREREDIGSMSSGCSSSSCDQVQAYLDAPVNAAVNVALKCATREASFEEVLSWLIGASSHQSGLEYAPPPYSETYTQTTHVSTYSYHPTGSGTGQDRHAPLLSSAYSLS